MIDFGVEHHVRVIEATVRASGGGPVHCVGPSFGGTVALAAAMARGFEEGSLSLFEANPVTALRHHGYSDLHDITLRMSQNFERAVHVGERDAAAHIIDFWGTKADFAAMPEPVQDYCRQTTKKSVQDQRTESDIYVAAVHAAAEPHVVLNSKAAEIENACADVLRVGHEWKYPVRLTDLQATIEFKPGDVILKAIAAGAIGHFAFDMGACRRPVGGNARCNLEFWAEALWGAAEDCTT